MSGETGVSGRELTAKPGTQLLLPGSSMGSPLASLPRSAYDGLVVVSSKSPSTVASAVERAGGNPSTVGHIPISGAEYDYAGPMHVCDPLVPDDLTGLSMRLSRAFESMDGGWLLVENLNVFLLYAAEERVVRFFDHLTALAADHGVTGVYSLTSDAVPAELYDRLCLSVDDALTDR